MITYTMAELTQMKPAFIKWLETSWCECIESTKKWPDFCDDTNDTRHDGHPCCCYGRHEYDEIFEATVDDTAIVIHYGPRTLTLPFDDDDHPPADYNDTLPLFNRRMAGEPYITHDDTQWVGDDVDYYGPCIYFIQHIHATKAPTD